MNIKVSQDLFLLSSGSSQETGSEKAHVNGERSFLTARKEEKDEKKKDKSGHNSIFTYRKYINLWCEKKTLIFFFL